MEFRNVVVWSPHFHTKLFFGGENKARTEACQLATDVNGIIKKIHEKKKKISSNIVTLFYMQYKTMADNNSNNNSQVKQSSSRLSFPKRLHGALNAVEENNLQQVISWTNGGKAFKVHDLEKFERDILPRFFNTKKYASFTRALHAHGFKCARAGRQTGVCKCDINSASLLLLLVLKRLLQFCNFVGTFNIILSC